MKKINLKYKLNKKTIKECQSRINDTLNKLKKLYPRAHCSLNFINPLQLLIATILSAQCTDKRVNMVTPALFAKYPNAEVFAGADRSQLEDMIRSTGFYRNKAKNIQLACQKIVQDFNGILPDKMTDLVKLSGVARKTANVVLWNAFEKNEGIVVDTHVQRISQRLGWTDNVMPVKIEQDLMTIVPRLDWGVLSHLLIDLGRDVCKAPTPDCKNCKICDICPWFKYIITPAKRPGK
jgi:endonuclease-3